MTQKWPRRVVSAARAAHLVLLISWSVAFRCCSTWAFIWAALSCRSTVGTWSRAPTLGIAIQRIVGQYCGGAIHVVETAM
jgi:hypothetical protein